MTLIVCVESHGWSDGTLIDRRFRALPQGNGTRIICRKEDGHVQYEALRRGFSVTATEHIIQTLDDDPPDCVIVFHRDHHPGVNRLLRAARRRGVPTETHWRL